MYSDESSTNGAHFRVGTIATFSCPTTGEGLDGPPTQNCETGNGDIGSWSGATLQCTGKYIRQNFLY